MDSRKLLMAALIASAGTAFAANDQSQATSRSDQPQDVSASVTSSGNASADASIRQAQQALKDKGHDPGAIDGVMGPRTASALRDFQAAQGLSASGSLDAQTLGALNGSASASPLDASAPAPMPSDNTSQAPAESTIPSR